MNKRIGAHVSQAGTQLCVWAPFANSVDVMLCGAQGAQIFFPLQKTKRGYFEGVSREFKVGDLYKYRIDGKQELPDPASCYQPQGPHGPSQIVDHKNFNWHDQGWKGIDLRALVIYELHVGTFTEDGTFLAIAEKIEHLKKIGVNAIELMPIAQFPGSRNWGYDGVDAFAVQNSYGKQNAHEELKQLIDICHYNHMVVMLVLSPLRHAQI